MQRLELDISFQIKFNRLFCSSIDERKCEGIINALLLLGGFVLEAPLGWFLLSSVYLYFLPGNERENHL